MLFDESPVIGRARTGPVRRVATLRDHASPLAASGSIDCGGQHMYVANLARELALSRYMVDVFTRRDAPSQPPLVQSRANVRVVPVPAGAGDAFPPERTRIELGLMRHADRIIAECPQDRLDMEQLYGAPSARQPSGSRHDHADTLTSEYANTLRNATQPPTANRRDHGPSKHQRQPGAGRQNHLH